METDWSKDLLVFPLRCVVAFPGGRRERNPKSPQLPGCACQAPEVDTTDDDRKEAFGILRF
jgi:hypothetical protein